ncbi:MAG: hypothetical protein J6S60_06215 [Oscillospiraceae bacterium]|nr:hypothetical protein [Oscillospiraceae bacterium]
MALFKDFTFDGENSKDYGVYISGEAVYNAPDRAMDMVQIPGRNGALALDNGYYNNIPVTYPAGIFAGSQQDFAAKLSRIRNMLASRHRYCRLEDSYHTEYFRLALYRSGLDVSPVAMNRAGRFNITFDAKPQRFLKTGEEIQALDADEPPTTEYGPAEIVTFEGEPGDAIAHGQWPLDPIQDLHGYDAPWPAGGGKNKIVLTTAAIKAANSTRTWNGNTTTFGGLTFTIVEDGAGNVAAINVSGTSSNIISFYVSGAIASGDYVLNGCPSNGSNSTYRIIAALDGGNSIDYGSGVAVSGAINEIYIRFSDGYAISGTLTFKPMLRLSTEADDTFAPYSNICPISGWTGAEITAKGVNLWDEEVESGYINQNTGLDGSVNTELRSPSGVYYNIFPSTQYYFVQPVGSARILLYNADKQYTGTKIMSGGVFTTPSDAHYFRLTLGNQYGITYNHDISINYPSTDTAYHASVGTTHDISWSDEAGMVYGGLLEYLGGQAWRLTVLMASVDMGDLPWAWYSGEGAYYDAILPSGAVNHGWCACSVYPRSSATSVGTQEDKSVRISATKVFARDLSITGANPFKASVAGQQFVYELATPVVYDLIADELQALIGTNNVFSDTGTTTITVQSPYELENPTLYPSKPLIRVYGSGTIQVNDVTITVAVHPGYIDIDCDLMDCYMGADNMNQYVSFSGNDFPELVPGINRILLNGPERVEITPRWWEL